MKKILLLSIVMILGIVTTTKAQFFGGGCYNPHRQMVLQQEYAYQRALQNSYCYTTPYNMCRPNVIYNNYGDPYTYGYGMNGYGYYRPNLLQTLLPIAALAVVGGLNNRNNQQEPVINYNTAPVQYTPQQTYQQVQPVNSERIYIQNVSTAPLQNSASSPLPPGTY